MICVRCGVSVDWLVLHPAQALRSPRKHSATNPVLLSVTGRCSSNVATTDANCDGEADILVSVCFMACVNC